MFKGDVTNNKPLRLMVLGLGWLHYIHQSKHSVFIRSLSSYKTEKYNSSDEAETFKSAACPGSCLSSSPHCGALSRNGLITAHLSPE